MSAARTTPRTGTRGSRTAFRASARHAERSGEASPYDDYSPERLWEEYRSQPSEPLRNHIMERFLHLVRYNAERIYARLPDEVDIEDLMSAGLFGLMDAIDAYDPGRQVKFETYCAPRIRGAILDELRSMDWVPRLVRHRTARVEAMRQQIEMETGNPASDEEVAARLDIDPEQFEKYKRDSRAVSVSSITRKATGDEDGRETREIEVVKEEAFGGPVQFLQRRDLKELITRGLNRAERLIVVLYYYEGMTMKEIGQTLDLSESRVSQMHSSILQRLKAQMQHRMRELEPVSG